MAARLELRLFREDGSLVKQSVFTDAGCLYIQGSIATIRGSEIVLPKTALSETHSVSDAYSSIVSTLVSLKPLRGYHKAQLLSQLFMVLYNSSGDTGPSSREEDGSLIREIPKVSFFKRTIRSILNSIKIAFHH
jgi:hypothetical protein